MRQRVDFHEAWEGNVPNARNLQLLREKGYQSLSGVGIPPRTHPGRAGPGNLPESAMRPERREEAPQPAQQGGKEAAPAPILSSASALPAPSTPRLANLREACSYTPPRESAS